MSFFYLLLICALWSVYAHKWQVKKAPDAWLSNTQTGKLLHLSMSFLFCPISMLMAILLFNRNNK